MNVCIEKTNDGFIKQGVLYVNSSELLIITDALRELIKCEERHLQDRAKAESMRTKIYGAVGGGTE